MISRLGLCLLLASVFSTHAAVVFPTGSTWRLFPGTNEASLPDTLAWTSATNRFDDAHFTNAPAPFFYGGTQPAGTPLDDMQGRYSCIFLRKTFVLTNTTSVRALQLNYLVDDGLVVWLNGREIWRENVTGAPLRTNTLATGPRLGTVGFTNVTVTPPSGVLLDGSNVVAVQVFNAALNDDDFAFDFGLDAFEIEFVPPVISSATPVPGVLASLTSVRVTFSEPVVGVTPDDFLINTQPASSVSGVGTTYTFNFAQPEYGTVYISWFPGHGIVDLALPPNAFDGTAPASIWTYQLVDETPPVTTKLFPAAGATVRGLSQVEVTFSEEVAGVEAEDLLVDDKPASSVQRLPGGPYVFQFSGRPPGPVQLRWAAAHGITDQAAPGNGFAGGAWSYVVEPASTPGDLVINEILAANIDGLSDEEGEPQDWIEIRNRGTTTVDLTAWSLSDDPDLPGLWVFPSRTLAPGQYLVVFASGKDRKNPTGQNRLHTNFRLGVREFIGLYNADSPRVLVSSLGEEYPEQRNDFSYGYDLDGPLRYFAVPTPGAANGSSTITGVVEPVHFSTTRGVFTQPFLLVLTCPTPGAQIRYTRNGAEPTLFNSAVYVAPLPVTNTMVLRAAAFRTNMLPSTVGAHSYFFNLSAALRSLPILSIQTATSNLYGRSGILGMGGGSRGGDGAFITNNPATDYHNPSAHGIAWERPVSAELIRPGDNSGFQIDCGIRVQGSDWQRPRTVSNTKFSYRLYFRGDYGPGRLNYPLFPTTTVQSFDQLVLRAGYNEPSNPFVRDEMSRRLFADMGNVSAQGNFVHVYTNGFYAGYYNPCERVHEEFGQTHHGGSDQWDVVGPSFAMSSEGFGVVDGDRNDFNSLHNYVNGQSITSIRSPAVYNEIARRLDLPNFVDYCLVNVYGAMGDWPPNNWRAGRDRGPGGIWRFYVWDAEWGLGYGGRGYVRDTFSETGGGPGDSGLASTGNSEIARIHQSLRRSPEIRLLWADRIYKHFFNRGALTQLAVTNRLVQMRTELSTVFTMDMGELGPFLANRQRNIFDDFERYGLFGHSNSLYGVYASSNAPVYNQHGGPVPPGFMLTMTAPRGGTIYYTMDEADPRVRFTGAVSNAAVTYGAPIPLTGNTVIKARTLLNGTNWSALAEAVFAVASQGVPLRISEIMYNPPGGSIHEFIELQNIGGASIDLSGMYFSEGIEFTFNAGSRLAPGARLVLANGTDPNAFATRYPGLVVAGYFEGNLNNAGEQVTLRDAVGRLVVSVNYDDANGWPTASDGSGRSLELVDPLGRLDDPANWRASVLPGGSPGQAGPTPTVGAVRLSEALAWNLTSVVHGETHPDFVELHNNGPSAVDLAGWSLSDDGTPGEFVFPVNTTIPAGQYLVVWCDAPGSVTPGLHAGFELDPAGDGIFLFDPALQRMDALTFGRQVADRSLARFDDGWLLAEPTPGAANSTASTAGAIDLVLNEWMANPLPGQSDWIELFNTSSLPVPLEGVYVGTTSAVHRLAGHSFVAPLGFVQLFADEGSGPDHLGLRLPATGGALVLLTPSAIQVQRVLYGAQKETISEGRLPDGAEQIVSFPGTSSPGAPNYATSYVGPVLGEVLARNVQAVTHAGGAPDFIELHNTNLTTASLAGMSLSVDSPEAGQWFFPPDASLEANAYLVIWCDADRPASFGVGDYNTGRSLDGQSGGVYLFNPAGQRVHAVEYGAQVQDRSVGLSDGQWRLLSVPTPGQPNAAPATLGTPTALRINEWLARPVSGPDWVELHNTNDLPLELSGFRFTDELSLAGTNQFRIAPLSFIGGRGFARWIADGATDLGRDHLSFSLDAQGEGLRLYAANGTTVLDTVVFSEQALGESQGRLPDGAAAITRFPGAASPAAPNYVLIPGLAIQEVLSHAGPPLEDAVELLNSGGSEVDLSGWFLSNSQGDFRKYRIPDGTGIAAGGYRVLTQGQFNTGLTPFTLNSALGDEVWLSAADAYGNLTGARAVARVGPALSGVSFGRVLTSVGVDYAPARARTLGQPNALPQVGPVVINEIYYNPPDGPGAEDEYVELLNVSGATVSLLGAGTPAQPWKLSGGIEYPLPSSLILPADGFALVVGFDPADGAALEDFRRRHGVSENVPVLGPFSGRLDNAGDLVELRRPGTPQADELPVAGFVSSVLVDGVNYGDSAPWPAGDADGGGLSLQRKAPGDYGNEPLNWVAAAPTPGAPNRLGVVPPPVVITQPVSQTVLEGAAPTLTVGVNGLGPLRYQWRLNRIGIPAATNSSYILSYAVSGDSGSYDVIVSNPGGSALSSVAELRVRVPPIILMAPTNVYARLGSNAIFSVVARGDEPLTYQWRRNGINLTSETGPTLIRPAVDVPDEAIYGVVVSSPLGTVSASASLLVLINPVLTLGPLSQTVVAGGRVTLSATYTGHPSPFTNEWRKSSPSPLTTNVNVIDAHQDFFTFTAPTVPQTVLYRFLVRNLANPVGVGTPTAITISVLADTDRDGIPDVWESLYRLPPDNAANRDLDPDGDGMSNWSEYIAGTDPTDPLSYLRTELVSGPVSPSAAVEFNAVSNKTYSVQYSDGLAGPWRRLADIPARSTTRGETVLDPVWTTNRFYRLVTPRQP